MTSLLKDLPAQLFSPFKMFFIAYVIVLVHSNVSNIDWRDFALASAIFLIGEIIHNDYLRIKFNHAACKDCQCKK